MRRAVIQFSNQQKKIRPGYPLRRLVRDAIEAALAYENIDCCCEISVTFTDNEGIHEINREWRNVDRPTDVLSFPQIDGDVDPGDMDITEGAVVLGDIVLSLERAREQAAEYGHTFVREVAFLCVHSVLHLLGYDHEAGGEEEQDMFTRQEEVLEAMGLTR